jgi:hypothetical protein
VGGIRIGDKPKLLSLGKFLGEIGEDIGEDFAFAALGAANAGKPNPLLPVFRYGHRDPLGEWNAVSREAFHRVRTLRSPRRQREEWGIQAFWKSSGA